MFLYWRTGFCSIIADVLVPLFANEKTNPEKAKLIFSMHNIGLLEYDNFKKNIEQLDASQWIYLYANFIKKKDCWTNNKWNTKIIDIKTPTKRTVKISPRIFNYGVNR